MKTFQVSVLGTANSSVFFPDLMVNPFNISVACAVNTTGQAATWTLQYCFDYATAYLPTWDGSTNVTWQNSSGISNATTAISASIAFPVVAMRFVVSASTATTVVTGYFTQSDTVPS